MEKKPRRGNVVKQNNRERAWNMHIHGITILEIAEQLNVTTRTVDNYLAEKKDEIAASRVNNSEIDDLAIFLAELDENKRRVNATLANLPIDSPQRTGLYRLLADMATQRAKMVGLGNQINMRHTGADGKSPISVEFNWSAIAQEVEQNRLQISEDTTPRLTSGQDNYQSEAVDAEFSVRGDK